MKTHKMFCIFVDDRLYHQCFSKFESMREFDRIKAKFKDSRVFAQCIYY